MTTDKKMTYAQALTIAIELIGEFSMCDENGNVVREYPEVVERLTTLKGTIEKRQGAKRKPTKTQIENERIKGEILTYLKNNDSPKVASEIAQEFSFSTQKVSALLKQMEADGTVTVDEVKIPKVGKRKAYSAKVAE